MTWKSQPNFGDHVRGKLADISYFTVFLSWHAFKHFKTLRKWWGILELVLLHEITRSIGKMIYQPSVAKLHSQKKEMQLFNFLRGWFLVTLPVLKLLNIARTVNNFGIGFFACCYQRHRQNEMHYKFHLSTLFPKRNATFHGAFLLSESKSHFPKSAPQH